MKHITLCLLALCLTAPGCRSKKSESDKTGGKTGQQKKFARHSDGPHGGYSFDIGKHEYMAEILIKDGTLHLYFHEHNDKEKPILAEESEIKITAIKVDGKKLPDITLPAKPQDGETKGSSHFELGGDAVKEITRPYALHGAKFQATIQGKKFDVVVHVKKPKE